LCPDLGVPFWGATTPKRKIRRALTGALTRSGAQFVVVAFA
jgi:hypothetical protein